MAFIQQRWYLISNFNECTVKVSKLTRLTFRKVDANRAPQIGCMPATKFGSVTITGLKNRDFSCHFKKISLSNLGFLILVIILACFYGLSWRFGGVSFLCTISDAEIRVLYCSMNNPCNLI